MSLLSLTLLPASFRGIPFLVVCSTITSGRKTVSHEFPNSDRRYVEDLGFLNENIDIEAQVSSDFYYSQRDALKNALEAPGYGTFIHPFYGTRNVAVISYSINESPNSLGQVEFRITFAVGQDLLFPGATDDSSLVAGQASILGDNTVAYFLENFNVVSSYSNTYASLLGTTGAWSGLVNGISSSFTVQSTFDDSANSIYSTSFQSFNNNVVANIVTPANLPVATGNLVNALDNISNDGQQGFVMGQQLATFSLPAPLYILPNSPQQINFNQNNNALLSLFLIWAFIQTARNIVLYPVVSLDDINMLRAELDSQYLRLLNLINEGSEVLSNIQDIRSSVMSFLDKEVLTAPQVTSVNVSTTPLSILTYQYYGNLDQVDSLRLLNHISMPDPTEMSGSFKLYTNYS